MWQPMRPMAWVYALVLLHRDEPRLLVAARLGPPLVIGLGTGEHYVASDIPALLPQTRDFLFLEDGDVATLTPDAVRIVTLGGAPAARTPQRIAWDPVQAEKGGFRHFMLKEIHEQPRAMRDTLLGRFSLEEGAVHLEELGPAAERLRGLNRAVLLACGTSWHAALVGKFLIEHLAGIPAEVDYGSEFRYRQPLVGKDTLAVAISQSGETADTLGAFREAKARGALPIAIKYGAGCGTCIKVCPLSKPYTYFHRAVNWTMRHVPMARRFGIWGDDLMGYGKPDQGKKWWHDLEWVDSELRVPPKKGEKDHDYM